MNILTILKQSSSLILYLLLSWILIHFLALFGLFFALAIPLLHLVFYPHIICFWCRLKGVKHTSLHSIIDGGLILVLTAISIPLVFLEYRILQKFVNPVEIAHIAQFTIPSKNQYPVGEIFPFKIELMNIPAAINVVQADLSFDPNLVEVVDLSVQETFADFFVQKEFDNTKGYLRVSGGIPNPGYREPQGLLAIAYLRGKKPGAIKLQYLDSSLVLANDGKGSNLLADYPSIPFIITPANALPSASPNEAIRIFNQVQGDTDKTVLSFTEYATSLPQPLNNTLGVSEANPTNYPSVTQKTNFLLNFDQQVINFWKNLYLLN